MNITCAEELRGALNGLPGRTLALALTAADPDVTDAREAAKAAFGLEPAVEHDGPPPSCGYCGRSAPPGGLADISAGGPRVHECQDSQDCQSARAQAEPLWMDRQYKFWKIDWDKYRRIQQYEAEQAAHTRYGGGIYALTVSGTEPPEPPEPDEQFLAALTEVRLAVEHTLQRRAGDYVELAGQLPGMADPATPDPAPAPAKTGISRRCREPDCFHDTMRCPDNRRHTVGYFKEHPRVHDAAGAMARRDMLARARGLRYAD